MKKQNDYTESSGNVFEDLNVPDAELNLLKADLAIVILNAIDEKKLTQTMAAKLLGVQQPEISKLKSGNYTRFGIERLFQFLNTLGRSVDIRITRAGRHAVQTVSAA